MQRLPDMLAPAEGDDLCAPSPPLRGFQCRECGGDGTPNRWQARVGRVLVANQLCLTCQAWAENVASRDEPEMVRAEGRHHIIGPEAEPRLPGGLMRGCGGARFRIRFFDGREVETTNLWNQGAIPEHFRERLPDNAEFVP